jgi:hypothetical protein
MRVRRADQLLQQARGFAERENWPEVQRTATASLSLNDSIEALRLLVASPVRSADPRLRQIALRLFAHPDNANADRARAIEILLDHHNTLDAVRLNRSMDPEARTHPAVRHQIVRLHLMAANYAEAITLADEPDPNRDPALDLLLAEEIARTDQEDAREITTSRIQRVLDGEDQALALRALRLLVALPGDWIHENLAVKALQHLGNAEGLDPADQLHLVHLRIILNEDDRKELINNAVARHRSDTLDTLALWLLSLNETERIVELTDPAANPSGLGVSTFESRAMALQTLGRFDQLEAELENPPAALPEITLLASRAAIAAKGSDHSRAVLLWRQAFKRAQLERGENWFYPIASVAAQAGERDYEMEALAVASSIRVGRPPPRLNSMRSSPGFTNAARRTASGISATSSCSANRAIRS